MYPRESRNQRKRNQNIRSVFIITAVIHVVIMIYLHTRSIYIRYTRFRGFAKRPAAIRKALNRLQTADGAMPRGKYVFGSPTGVRSRWQEAENRANT